MIFLEICLMLNNIALNRPVLVAIWLVCIFLSIINLALDDKEENTEFISFANNCDALADGYSAMFNLSDIKNTLSVCDEDELTMHFGDTFALVISRTNIFNVIPEYHD